MTSISSYNIYDLTVCGESSVNLVGSDVFKSLLQHPETDGVAHFVESVVQGDYRVELNRALIDIVRVPPSARIVIVGSKGDEMHLQSNDEEFTYFPLGAVLYNEKVLLYGARKVKVYSLQKDPRRALVTGEHTFNGTRIKEGFVTLC